MRIIKILLLVTFVFPVQLINAQNKEYILKADFLAKFVAFNQWPKYSSDSEFKISVIGDLLFDEKRDELLLNQVVIVDHRAKGI